MPYANYDNYDNNKRIWWKRLLGNFCFKRIMHAHFLFLDGMITEEERDDIIFYWKTIKAKWVLDQCHHLCKLCKYKHECWSNAKEL